MTIPLIIGGVLLAILILLILVFITKYRTVGPDEALIVTGNWLGGGKNVVTTDDGKKIKIIRGGGTFVVPIMQRAELLSLLNYKLEVGTRDTYTKQGVPITVNGVSIIKVGSTIEEVSTAAEQYLGKETEELKIEAKEVLEGHLRAILSSMTVEDAYSNREQFAQKVHEVASTDLKKMGLRIVSFTIKEIMDKNGYLDALGQPKIATVKRDATIANAEREKEARIEKARAEKEAKEAEYQRDAQIAEAEKHKELKVQSYKREQEQEQARADADLSYELQQAKAQQGVTEEQMRVKIIEREKQIELEEKEIARREKQYDAEVKKKADADRYAVEQSAEAEKVKQIKKADADQYKIEAEARARAEEVRVEGLAKAEIEKAQGQAKAEVQKAQGTAEADVIRLKGLAEAKQKIAEAFELYGQAAIMDMVLKMLPSYAKELASPLSNIDKITVVDTGGGGKNSGAGKVAGYATDLMATMQETLKASSGIDLKELLEGFAGKGAVQQLSSDKPVVSVVEDEKKEVDKE
ncbi:TPA: flotillin family protein [Bacillus cereus]|nr:flotillin family protein [Bacillus cereus]